jgi:hypothetical protein
MPCINDYTDEEYNGTPVHKCRINKCDPYPCDGCAKDNKCYIEQSPAAVPQQYECPHCGCILIWNKDETIAECPSEGYHYTYEELQDKTEDNGTKPAPTLAQFRADLLSWIDSNQDIIEGRGLVSVEYKVIFPKRLMDYITAYGRETHV